MKSRFAIFLVLSLTSCSQTEQDYFRLDSQFTWEYQFQKRLNNDVNIGKSIVAQLEKLNIEGVNYYPHKSVGGESYYYRKGEGGVYISPEPNMDGELFLKYPLEVGTKWQRRTQIEVLDSRHESFAGGETFISLDEEILLNNRITSFDEIVEVPAGRFQNCMRVDATASVTVKERTRGIDQILIEQTEWYAKGVGLVKRVRKEYSQPEKYQGELLTELIDLRR